MSARFLDLYVNLLGLIGFALLSWPSFYAARLATLAARLERLGPIVDTPRAQDIHDKAKKEVEKQRAAWGPGLSFCLVAGTGATAISFLLGVIKFFVSP